MLGLAREDVTRRLLTTAAGEKLQQQAGGGRGERAGQIRGQGMLRMLVEVEKDREQSGSSRQELHRPGSCRRSFSCMEKTKGVICKKLN